MEHLHRVVVIAAWVGLIIWAWRGDALGRWWWAATLLTTAATLTTPGTGQVIDTITGVPGLAVGGAHAAVAVAAGLALRAQLAARRPGRAIRAHTVDVTLIIVATALFVTSSTAPVTHTVIYYSAVAGAGAGFAALAGQEAREFATGRARTVAQLLAAAAAATALWAGVRAVAELAVPATVRTAAAVGSGGLLAMAVLSAAAALLLALAHRRDTYRQVAEQGRDVIALWNWLCDTDQHSDDLFGVVIETRDRMWMTQQWVGVSELAATTELARRLGLRGRQARAFATAVCLELGLSALDNAAARPAESADLSQLGGGSSPEEEAAWFASVWRARADHHAAAAAVVIHQATLSITEPDRGTVGEP